MKILFCFFLVVFLFKPQKRVIKLSSFSFLTVLGLFGEEAALAGFLKNLTKIAALVIMVSN
ncbi:MAG: hypothetical protein ACOX5S_01960 [Patescibacteria group bacterium]|jgi:hypothetical protein